MHTSDPQNSTSIAARNGRSATTPNVSVTLDLIRFFLAAAVAIGYMSQQYFQENWPDMTRMGIFSVGGFFILSGFTIRSFTDHDSFNIRQFFVDRPPRLLSITLISLVLTVLLDRYAAGVAPEWCDWNWRQLTDNPVMRLAANTFLLNQRWGKEISPLSNSPFWSLGYEAGFCVISDALLYSRRSRKTMLLPIVIASVYGYGPRILSS